MVVLLLPSNGKNQSLFLLFYRFQYIELLISDMAFSSLLIKELYQKLPCPSIAFTNKCLYIAPQLALLYFVHHTYLIYIVQ